MNDTATIEKEAQTALQVAKDFKITNPEQFTKAGEMLKSIKGIMKQIADTFDPIIKKAHEAHKEAVAQRKKHEEPLQQAEGIYKQAMLTYQNEQERIRREQQARLEEAARKEREKLEKQAETALAKGKTEKAAELQTRAATVATPVVAISTPKVSGIGTVTRYSAKVTNPAALIEAIAGGRRMGAPRPAGQTFERRRTASAPSNLVEPNTTVLNALARSMKEGFSYPGCQLVTDKGISSRSA